MSNIYKNPWKRKTSRLVYENAWIRLREDEVITPSGEDGIYGVVETKPALGIVVIDDTLNTYLVGQYRYAVDTYSWEIPEGGGEKGESLIESAKRELKEETGLIAAKWTSLSSFNTSNSCCDEEAHLFLAENLEKGKSSPDSTEKLIIKKCPLKEAWEMVLRYEIKDSLTIIGLMRTIEFLRKENRLNF